MTLRGRFPLFATCLMLLLAISPSSAQITINGGGSYATLQDAVTAASAGDVIEMPAGTYPIAAQIAINKNNLTIQGVGSSSTILQVSGTGERFFITASGVTLQNMQIQKTDKGGVQNIIYVGANNVAIKNNDIHGQFVIGDGDVSRAMVVTGGLSGLVFEGNTIYGLRQPAYISGPTTGIISNNFVYGTKGWVLEGGDMTFTGNTWGSGAQTNVYDIAILSAAPPTAYLDIVAMSNANNGAVIEDQRVSPAVLSVVYVDASMSYVSDLGGKYHPYSTISPAIARVVAGGTINVAAGTYDEDVNLTKSLALLGAGAASTTIRGVIGGDGATVRINASNVTVGGFTISRLGNNTTDWNNAGLNSGGVAVQGTSFTGMTLRDNTITGNRTGIDINNSSGHTIRNNAITFNRTGFVLRNQTDNLSVVENEITNNWTVGFVFLDGSLGTNNPVQTALNCVFSNNNISGNWYGQIVERQTGGSLPIPGTTNLKSFGGNWFGTTAPVITADNSTEPAYAAQIPVAYGGTAVAPGGQPDIAGPASANIDFTPFLNSGTDTNVETTSGRGTFGFQGDFSTLWVSAVSPQIGSVGRIQEAINTVIGSTVNILAGTYLENVDVNKLVTLQGAGSSVSGTIITPPTGVGLRISSTGLSTSQKIIIKDLRITGAPGNGVEISGNNSSFLRFENVACVANGGNGVNVNTPTAASTLTGFELVNCVLSSHTSSGGTGFRVPTYASLDGITISGCTIDGNTYGVQVYTANPAPLLTNVVVSNTTFNNNTSKGLYLERISNGAFTNVTINSSGTAGSFAAGADFNLKYGAFANLSFTGCTVTNCGTGDATNGVGLTVKARDDGSYASNAATLNNVTITNCTVKNNQNGVRFGEPGKNNVGPTGVVVTGSTIEQNLTLGMSNQSQTLTNAENNWWGNASGPFNAATNPSGTGNGASDNIDFDPWVGKAPGATTNAATNVSAGDAQLNGLVNPGGVATTYFFEYGPTTAYGMTTSVQNAGSGTANVPVNAVVTSLLPGSQYHCRVVAQSANGTTRGSDVTFTTTASLLVNGGFESGTAPWVFFTNGSGTFDANSAGPASPHAAHLNMVTVGTNVQLYLAPITLEAGTLYRLSFKAYSSSGHDFLVSVHQHDSPYAPYGLTYQRFDLGAAWGSHSIEFTASGFSGTVTDGRLRFWFVGYATAGDQYYLDDVILEKVVSTGAPTAVTTAATNVTTTSAQMNGTVNPGGGATVYSFEYGPTTSYGSTTPPLSAGSGTSSVLVNAPWSGLAAGTTYHYRLVAQNAAGTSTGNDMNFTTATEGVPGPSLVKNGGFEEGTAPWTFFTNGAGSLDVDAPGAASAHAAHISIVTGGTNIQLHQSAITLEAGVRYRLSFKAYSSSGNDLAVAINQHGPPYADYGLSERRFDLGTSWGSYVVEFNASGFAGTVNDGRLRFWFAPFAANGDQYYIDDVVLEKVLPTGVPTVATGAASSITTTSAQLNGSLNPNGSATTYHFEYGLTTAYGSATPAQNAGSGSALTTVNAPLASLSSGVVYHYRLVAQNPSGTVQGDDVSFTTSSSGGPVVSLLTNAGFEEGTAPWVFFTNASGSFDANAAGSGSAHAAHIAIGSAGTNVQLFQAPVTLQSGMLYRLSFKAYSSSGNDMSLAIHQHGAPYAIYGLPNQRFDLTTVWGSYAVQFVASGFSGTATDGRLRFWFASYAVGGDEYFIDDVVLEKVTGTSKERVIAESAPTLPTEPILAGNFPNPFNPSTLIEFALPDQMEVELTVYSTMGQRINTLVKGVWSAGVHHVRWNGADENGRAVASGVYYCRMAVSPPARRDLGPIDGRDGQTGNTIQTKRLVLLK